MQLIDEQGKFFGIVNTVDLTVIALVLVVGFLAASRFLTDDVQQPLPDETHQEILLETEISEVREPTVRAIEVGDVVRDNNSGQIIGEIIEKQVEPHRTPVETAAGEVIMAEVPERQTILLTLKAHGQVTETAVTVAGNEVRVGTSLMLQGQIYRVRSTVLHVEILD